MRNLARRPRRSGAILVALAGASLAVTAACSGPRVRIASATPIGDGADLIVTLDICRPGSEPPPVQVAETATEVSLFVDQRTPDDMKSCATTVTVHLTEPLGHRVLLDGHTRRAIPAGPDVS